jgi:aminomethyltransferase
VADKTTFFNDKHIAVGARMVPFAGYMMPLQYSGIQKEHRAVRENVGLFDLSHMGEFMCRGEGALAFLQRMMTNDVSALSPGQVQYTAMCYDEGGFVDDLLVYNLSGEFMLVVNASNIDKDWQWLVDHKPDGVELENISDQLGLLAIQGPNAEQVVGKITPYDLGTIPFYSSARAMFGTHELIISRTGYTGEDGFEIYCTADAAHDLWHMVIEAGTPVGMEFIGLGARDSLRLEMRYALYGHEIDATTNPIAAGLSWICKLDKGDFVGRDPIRAMKETRPKQKMVSLLLGPKTIPRQHYKVWAGDELLGEIRSGIFSPSLGRGIATALVPLKFARVGTELQVEVRGKREPAVVVKPPFYTDGSHK